MKRSLVGPQPPPPPPPSFLVICQLHNSSPYFWTVASPLPPGSSSYGLCCHPLPLFPPSHLYALPTPPLLLLRILASAPIPFPSFLVVWKHRPSHLLLFLWIVASSLPLPLPPLHYTSTSLSLQIVASPRTPYPFFSIIFPPHTRHLVLFLPMGPPYHFPLLPSCMPISHLPPSPLPTDCSIPPFPNLPRFLP